MMLLVVILTESSNFEAMIQYIITIVHVGWVDR